VQPVFWILIWDALFFELPDMGSGISVPSFAVDCRLQNYYKDPVSSAAIRVEIIQDLQHSLQ
jgi:hypothetical protein